MTPARRGALAVALGAVAALGACGTDRAAPPDPGTGPDEDDPLALSVTPASCW